MGVEERKSKLVAQPWPQQNGGSSWAGGPGDSSGHLGHPRSLNHPWVLASRKGSKGEMGTQKQLCPFRWLWPLKGTRKMSHQARFREGFGHQGTCFWKGSKSAGGRLRPRPDPPTHSGRGALSTSIGLAGTAAVVMPRV